jgi:hypothetical protein
MFDLVIWSFVIALAPVALGLFWKLISRTAYFLAAGRHGRPLESGYDWNDHRNDLLGSDLRRSPTMSLGRTESGSHIQERRFGEVQVLKVRTWR